MLSWPCEGTSNILNETHKRPPHILSGGSSYSVQIPQIPSICFDFAPPTGGVFVDLIQESC